LFKLSEDKEQKEVVKQIKKVLTNEKAKDVKKLMNIFLESASKSAGEEVGEKSIRFITAILSGCMSEVPDLLEALKSLMKKGK